MAFAIIANDLARRQQDTAMRTDIAQRKGFSVMGSAKQDGLTQDFTMDGLPWFDVSPDDAEIPEVAQITVVSSVQPGLFFGRRICHDVCLAALVGIRQGA